jgi:hypothetical protein
MFFSGCSSCYKASRLRNQALKKAGTERIKLDRQAASLEAECKKKSDSKYDSKMNKQFEEMEKNAPD